MARASNDTSMLLTVEAASKLTGIPYTTLLQWIHDGHLPRIQRPDADGKKKTRYWIRRATLLARLEEWEESA